MIKLTQLFCILVIVTLSGCSSLQPLSQPVRHIVVVWLKEPGNVNHRQRILQASQKLTQIPGIISVQGGAVITDNRPVVDSSFDIALVITMRNRVVLNRYTQHPLHQQLLEEELKPLIEHYRVFNVQ